MFRKIKVNDNVSVMIGKDKGKKGKVTQILPSMDKAVVEGVNVMYKHLKPKQKGEKGQRIQFNGPLNLSNLSLICPKCNKVVKTGIKLSKNNKSKSRFCKKCNELID
tara:strand:+ start:324 stop:644 length:321 start_codon:yes stop_codon:yes gene_type:complete